MNRRGVLGGLARGLGGVAAAVLLLAATPASALEAATYKCVSRGKVVYTQIPCTGGRPLVRGGHRETDKYRTPPQDRARIARRAVLTPQERKECSALDVRLREQQKALEARGEAATLQDEMPLVQSKKRYRELGC
jgi:hypothetical protein